MYVSMRKIITLEKYEQCKQAVPPELSVKPSDVEVAYGCIKAALKFAPPKTLRVVSSLASLCHVQLPFKLEPAAICTIGKKKDDIY
ncbi:unnamed protein product [Microthlaspi erraticum]|uniref:Uncharacterized protein n=1 Tax=Microthlaspi erraticum TaxID=1685480 RepID=A0A6D2IDY1_9BRAS|nr:unnamed protein product [Microthlaspi erraticum]